ncbi:hypothetical protein T01_2133, partial [Trichinella spiralis]
LACNRRSNCFATSIQVRFEDRPPAAGEQFYTPCDRFNSDRQTGRSTVLKIWEVFKKIRLSPFDEFLLRDYIFPHRWSKCLQSRRVCLCPTVITGTSLIGKLRVHAGRVSHCQDAIPKGVL